MSINFGVFGVTSKMAVACSFPVGGLYMEWKEIFVVELRIETFIDDIFNKSFRSVRVLVEMNVKI